MMPKFLLFLYNYFYIKVLPVALIVQMTPLFLSSEMSKNRRDRRRFRRLRGREILNLGGLDLLKAVAREGRSVLVITHDQELIEHACSRVLHLA